MESPKKKMAAVGIDLGTSNSCVAVVGRNGRVEIIPNDLGDRLTPSFVAFTEDECLVGEAAKAQSISNISNSVYQVKRLMGRNYSDNFFEEVLKKLSYEVVPSNDEEGSNRPEIKVTFKNEPKRYSPEQISAMLLCKMKKSAENYLGVSVSEAVIAVPAYFNDSQRQATMDAAAIARLNVLKIINEPTAAALAYASSKPQQSKRNILIYDLGGGTLDVAIIAMQGTNYDVQAVCGDALLGGSDFDNILVDHFVKQFKNKHGYEISHDGRSLAKLRKACEKSKRKLSCSIKADIFIPSLYQGIDFKTSLSRVFFDELCSDLFKKSMDYVQKVLDDAQIEKNDIKEVVLVGGSTRIQMIQSMLQDFFDGVAPNKTINPDEAVAQGAAIQAAMITKVETVEHIFLRDITPLSLGIRTDNISMGISDKMEVIIKRNTKYPTTTTQGGFSTAVDYQQIVSINVYEGERQTASHNNLLGVFQLTGIEQALRAVPEISVTFSLNENGILEVTAVDQNTRSSEGITITSHKGRLHKKDIERMMIEGKKLELDEQERRAHEDARNSLELWLHQEKTKTKESKKRISASSPNAVAYGELCEKICNKCEESILWLEGIQHCKEKDYQQKKEEIQSLISALDNLHLL